MALYVVRFREKSNPYGQPIRSQAVDAPNAREALGQAMRPGARETWYDIARDGAVVITLAAIRKLGNDAPGLDTF